MTSPGANHLPVIDAHCHFGSGDGLTGPWDTRANIGDYLRRARRAGIQRTALIPVLSHDYTIGNRQVASVLAKYPGRFFGYIAVNPMRDRGSVRRIIEAHLRCRGFVGIKIHHYNGRMTREVCQAAQQLRLPILWDVGDDVSGAELVASEYPEVTLIIPHLGSFGDNWRAQRQCLDLLQRHSNVLADTSGVRRFDLLEEAVRRIGPSRLIFGSDGPWLHPAVELEKIRQLNLTVEQERQIVCANFLRVTSLRRSSSSHSQLHAGIL